MKKILATAAVSLLLSLSAASAQEGEIGVLTEALSIRETPEGRFLGTLSRGDRLPIKNFFKFWAMGERGWVNSDYGDYTFPQWKRTGQITLKIAKVVEPIGELKPKDVIIVAKEEEDRVIGLWQNEAVEVGKENLEVGRETFEIVVSNFDAELTDANMRATVKAGTPLLKGSEGFLFKGHLWSSARRAREEKVLNVSELLKEINRLIDIFNSVKLSSPLSERLGYFVKTLPVRSEDLKLVKTQSGVGAFVKLRHQFITKDGRVIKGRKTRFFLKKSNYEFWRKLTEEAFNSGLNKFFEIDIYRFDGEGGFEKGGFVASSYHLFKEDKLKDWESFVENSESNISEDLWFFADEVYERLESGGED